MLMTGLGSFKKAAVRAGFTKDLLIGEDIFKAAFYHPDKLMAGRSDPEDNFSELSTEKK